MHCPSILDAYAAVRAWCVPLVVCGLSATLAAGARQAVIDDAPVRRFLGELQRSVAQDDRAAVARLMHYPLTVRAAGVRIPIPDQAAFVTYYDAVFSPSLKNVIARAELVRAGQPAPAVAVTVSESGAFVHGDAVVIERVGDSLKVTRLSAPLAPLEPAPARAGGPVRPREPRRIAMGLRTVRLDGFLSEAERDSYLIWANKNQLLEVRIMGVRERDIVARIVRLETRAPLDASAREGARTWVGRIPESGEYRIDVVRLAQGRGPMSYVVSMRLR
jgi:hypothetical protein